MEIGACYKIPRSPIVSKVTPKILHFVKIAKKGINLKTINARKSTSLVVKEALMTYVRTATMAIV
jgi:hypothetical protein